MCGWTVSGCPEGGISGNFPGCSTVVLCENWSKESDCVHSFCPLLVTSGFLTSSNDWQMGQIGPSSSSNIPHLPDVIHSNSSMYCTVYPSASEANGLQSCGRSQQIGKGCLLISESVCIFSSPVEIIPCLGKEIPPSQTYVCLRQTFSVPVLQLWKSHPRKVKLVSPLLSFWWEAKYTLSK